MSSVLRVGGHVWSSWSLLSASHCQPTPACLHSLHPSCHISVSPQMSPLCRVQVSTLWGGLILADEADSDPGSSQSHVLRRQGRWWQGRGLSAPTAYLCALGEPERRAWLPEGTGPGPGSHLVATALSPQQAPATEQGRGSWPMSPRLPRELTQPHNPRHRAGTRQSPGDRLTQREPRGSTQLDTAVLM